MEFLPQLDFDKKFEQYRSMDVLQELTADQFTLEKCIKVSDALVNIIGCAMLKGDTESMAEFLDGEGCEALVNMMDRFGVLDEEIAANCCLLICILSWSLRDFKEFFGEIGACERVVYTASMHIGSARVSEYSTGAIGLLAKSNISNSYKIAEAGAFDILAQVGNFGLNIQNKRAFEVATNVCVAVAELAEAWNADDLLKSGVVSLIDMYVTLHMDSDKLAAAAAKAFCAIASLNMECRETLGKLGICKTLLEVGKTHFDSTPIVQHICESIMHLSLSPTNNVLLSEMETCNFVMMALKEKLIEHDFGAEVCSGSMLNLVTYGTSAKKNRLFFESAGAIEELKKAQISKKSSYRARENIAGMLDILGADSSDTQSHWNRNRNNSTSSNCLESNNQTIELPVSVIHGSEKKGSTIPLNVEVREVIEFNNIQVKTEERASSNSKSSITDDQNRTSESEIALLNNLSRESYPRYESCDNSFNRNASYTIHEI